MKNEFEKIDELIKNALTEEESKFYDNLEEQNVFQMLGGLFQGKNKWIMLLMNFVMLIVFGFLIYSVVQFFNTEQTNEIIRWSLSIITCLLVISMLKMFLWMQMDKNSIKREIKRMELQISTLSSKLSK